MLAERLTVCHALGSGSSRIERKCTETFGSCASFWLTVEQGPSMLALNSRLGYPVFLNLSGTWYNINRKTVLEDS